MNIFFDTSALIKYFHDEEGTDVVTELINNEDNTIWILEIAHLELMSAVFRRYRNNEIDDEQLGIALSGIEEELVKFNVEHLNHLVLNEAVQLIKQYGNLYGLRTLHSLQVSSFKIIAENDWKMVSSDDVMCTIIEKLGYSLINPVKQDNNSGDV